MMQKDKNNRNNKKPRAAKQQSAVREPMSKDEMRAKTSKERSRKRRRNRIIGYSLAVIAIIIIGVVLSLTVFFKVETIVTAGDVIYNDEQIISSSGIKQGSNMFLFDKDDAAANIEKSLPYIEKAVIKRNPTGKITIVITAAKAELALDMGDSFVLMNSSGKVLEDGVAVINDDITIITASAVVSATPGTPAEFENPTDLETAVGIEKQLTESGITNINVIDVRDYSNIILRYAQRINLKIGTASSLAGKADFIKATLSKHDADEPDFEGTINFTIDSKAYINANEETTALAPVAAVQS